MFALLGIEPLDQCPCREEQLGKETNCENQPGWKVQVHCLKLGAVLGNFVSDVSRPHPAVGKAIRKRAPETVPQMKFGLSGLSWEMPDGNLSVGPSFLEKDQRGKKSVHPLEERNLPGCICPQDLERATGVDSSIAGHEAPE